MTDADISERLQAANDALAAAAKWPQMGLGSDPAVNGLRDALRELVALAPARRAHPAGHVPGLPLGAQSGQ